MEERMLEMLKNERTRMIMAQAGGVNYNSIYETSMMFFNELGITGVLATELFCKMYNSITEGELNEAREVIKNLNEGVGMW